MDNMELFKVIARLNQEYTHFYSTDKHLNDTVGITFTGKELKALIHFFDKLEIKPVCRHTS